jgi:ribosomal protein S4E
MQVDINKKGFSRMIETYVRTHKGCQYIDAIIELCDQNEIDLRDAKKLVSKEIVQRIEYEARELNMIQGGQTSYTLPI